MSFKIKEMITKDTILIFNQILPTSTIEKEWVTVGEH